MPAKRVTGTDVSGAFDDASDGEFVGEFGSGISPAGRPRLPVRLMVNLLYL